MKIQTPFASFIDLLMVTLAIFIFIAQFAREGPQDSKEQEKSASTVVEDFTYKLVRVSGNGNRLVFSVGNGWEDFGTAVTGLKDEGTNAVKILPDGGLPVSALIDSFLDFEKAGFKTSLMIEKEEVRK